MPFKVHPRWCFSPLGFSLVPLAGQTLPSGPRGPFGADALLHWLHLWHRVSILPQFSCTQRRVSKPLQCAWGLSMISFNAHNKLSKVSGFKGCIQKTLHFNILARNKEKN